MHGLQNLLSASGHLLLLLLLLLLVLILLLLILVLLLLLLLILLVLVLVVLILLLFLLLQLGKSQVLPGFKIVGTNQQRPFVKIDAFVVFLIIESHVPEIVEGLFGKFELIGIGRSQTRHVGKQLSSHGTWVVFRTTVVLGEKMCESRGLVVLSAQRGGISRQSFLIGFKSCVIVAVAVALVAFFDIVALSLDRGRLGSRKLRSRKERCGKDG